MPDFFDHPHYRLNKMFLCFLGTWPEQNLLARCLIPFSLWAILMSVMIPEIIRISQVKNDVDTLLDCIPPILLMFVSFSQLFNGCINRQKLRKIFNHVAADWKRLGNSPNIEIIREYAARGHFLTKTYAGVLYSFGMFYLAMPVLPVIMNYVVPLNESREKLYLFEAEYGVESEDYYWSILAHAYITSIVAVVIITSCDVMFFAIVEHACGLFKIVGVNLELVNERTNGDDRTSKRNSYDMICHCIDLHRDAIIFADLIEASFSSSLMATTGLSLLTLSITGVQAVMHLGEFEEALRYESFSIAQIIHLYFNNVPGQKIIDYSLSVFDNAYAVNWHQFSPKAQKLLLMIMLRSSRPCKITAGKFFTLSMESYSAAMQTSMSYFTVLSSMR